MNVLRKIPQKWRAVHHLIAAVGGYFWIPCPVCGEPFGGHEWTESIPEEGAMGGKAICPQCADRLALRPRDGVLRGAIVYRSGGIVSAPNGMLVHFDECVLAFRDGRPRCLRNHTHSHEVIRWMETGEAP